jgi:hypothetical protein
MAELLLQRGPLSNVDKAKGDNSLEDLIWPYFVFNETTFDMEALPLPANSKGAALWATRSAKWTMASDSKMTSNKHPALFKEWHELNA